MYLSGFYLFLSPLFFILFPKIHNALIDVCLASHISEDLDTQGAALFLDKIPHNTVFDGDSLANLTFHVPLSFLVIWLHV